MQKLVVYEHSVHNLFLKKRLAGDLEIRSWARYCSSIPKTPDIYKITYKGLKFSEDFKGYYVGPQIILKI